MSYVYLRSEPRLWTVGFYQPDGTWTTDSDHGSRDEAARRAAWLNGSVPDPGALTRGRLIAALRHSAVTGALEGLDSQGGTPADLADALLLALREVS